MSIHFSCGIPQRDLNISHQHTSTIDATMFPEPIHFRCFKNKARPKHVSLRDPVQLVAFLKHARRQEEPNVELLK